MAGQEFLASYGVQIDEAGVARLQAILEGNRDLAEKLAAIYGVSPADLMGYRLSEDTRILKDERDIYRSRLEAREREFARILQEKQAEIERLNALVAQLRHDLDFTQSVCRQMMKQNNPQEDTVSEGENM